MRIPARPMAPDAVQAEKREALDRATRQAWEEYQATGLHLTGEEVSAWLRTWGTDEERPVPECHR